MGNKLREDRHVFSTGTFKVRCDGSLHDVELTKSGTLLLHGHIEDGDAQKLMLGLSGKTCRCYLVDAVWRKFLRQSQSYATHHIPPELPDCLRYEAGRVRDLRTARVSRRREGMTERHLRESSIKVLASKDDPPERIIDRRLRVCAERICEEIGRKVSYWCPSTHTWGEGFYGTAPWASGTRPSVYTVDEPVYGDSERSIVGVERLLRINSNAVVLVRTYVKTHCIALDGEITVALVALLGPYRNSKTKLIAFGGRQMANGSVEGSKCIIIPDGPAWRVERWAERWRL